MRKTLRSTSPTTGEGRRPHGTTDLPTTVTPSPLSQAQSPHSHFHDETLLGDGLSSPLPNSDAATVAATLRSPVVDSPQALNLHEVKRQLASDKTTARGDN